MMAATRIIGLFLIGILPLGSVYAQAFSAYPLSSSIKETVLHEFDAARPVVHFESTPTGSLWFAVDKFAQMQSMIINGKWFDQPFNEVPITTAQLSPDGLFVIWMGLERKYTDDGFNLTTTHLYKSTSSKDELIGKYTSDYNSLLFYPRFDKWVALLPAANVKQTGLRDLAIVNGEIISGGYPLPKMFSFDSTGTKWAYRSTDKQRENLVTKDTAFLLWTRSDPNPNKATDDPIVYHYTPDIKLFGSIFDGRDYSLDFRSEARLFKTSYLRSRADTAQSYFIYQYKKQPLYRRISSLQMDTGGTTIAYLAADPNVSQDSVNLSTQSVVVRDGAIVGGPYRRIGRLFMSPSGKHLAWTAEKDNVLELYLDGKRVGLLNASVELVWSRDEKRIAYVTNDDRGKLFVVAGGKRSALYDRVGRLGFSDDGNAVEFVGIRNIKLSKIRMTW